MGADMEHTTLLTASTPATALEVTEGEGCGSMLPLTDGFTLGRGATNSLAFSDPGISRLHAEIVWEDEGWVLRDVGSTNGTFVNGRKITAHAIRIGDLIQVGKTKLLVK